MRAIKLTKPLRTEIRANVMAAWDKEHPRPDVKLPHSAQALAQLNNWREARALIFTQAGNLLDSFSTLEQASTCWPAIMKFFPSYMLEPTKHCKLPKRAA